MESEIKSAELCEISSDTKSQPTWAFRLIENFSVMSCCPQEWEMKVGFDESFGVVDNFQVFEVTTILIPYGDQQPSYVVVGFIDGKPVCTDPIILVHPNGKAILTHSATFYLGEQNKGDVSHFLLHHLHKTIASLNSQISPQGLV